MRRSIITIATNRKIYTDMAGNLARSFFWWHPDTDIEFHIITDRAELLDKDVTAKAKIIIIKPGELGDGFSAKLHLDSLALEGQTLFIDSDCLIFGNLEFIFQRFKGHKVSVVGGYVNNGEWFGDIKQVCKRFNLPHLPKFNGGLYYLEKGPEATEVYQTARKLEKDYDKIGFTRLRNSPNDEVLMALAMQLKGQTPIIDDGTYMSDPQACPGGYDIDVISGERWLINPPKPDKLHQDWYPFEKVSPVIFHFLGYYTYHYPYRQNVFRLKRAGNAGLNGFYKLYSLLAIAYPEKLKNLLKDTFRSTYRYFLGVRTVKKTDRE